MDVRLEKQVAALRAAERGGGVRARSAPVAMGLLYPSPYHVAMSSLGYLQVHRLINGRRGIFAERAMLPDDPDAYRRTRTPLLTIESGRRVSELDVLGISHSYELESAGIVTLLELSNVAPLAADRTAADPLVVLGGPITFSNPLPSAPFADVVLLGEAEDTIHRLLDRIEADPGAARGNARARARLLEDVAAWPGFFVPSIHGEELPPIAKASDAELPAVSDIWTPNTELADMLLVEPERGCHRGCTFCVMRRSTNDGMRLVAPERVLELVPDGVPKVGLVGAAVTDHPRLAEILRALVDGKGKRVGVSSLRADRLDEEIVGLLARGGYRSMTVALDAPSARLRDAVEKNLRDRDVEAAAELGRRFGMRHLKVYVIVGLPGETGADIAELAAFATKLSQVLPIVLSVSPFVPKLNTPLADAPFAGEREAKAVLERLSAAVGPRVEVRGPSAREAYVEYRLAQGGFAHARAAILAARGGGRLSAWKRAFDGLTERVRPRSFERLVPPATARRRYALRAFGTLGGPLAK